MGTKHGSSRGCQNISHVWHFFYVCDRINVSSVLRQSIIEDRKDFIFAMWHWNYQGKQQSDTKIKKMKINDTSE